MKEKNQHKAAARQGLTLSTDITAQMAAPETNDFAPLRRISLLQRICNPLPASRGFAI